MTLSNVYYYKWGLFTCPSFPDKFAKTLKGKPFTYSKQGYYRQAPYFLGLTMLCFITINQKVLKWFHSIVEAFNVNQWQKRLQSGFVAWTPHSALQRIYSVLTLIWFWSCILYWPGQWIGSLLQYLLTLSSLVYFLVREGIRVFWFIIRFLLPITCIIIIIKLLQCMCMMIIRITCSVSKNLAFLRCFFYLSCNILAFWDYWYHKNEFSITCQCIAKSFIQIKA